MKLARRLEAAGAPIIGTTPDSIDLAEDRDRFLNLVNKLGLKQPANRSARSEAEAMRLAEEVGFPMVVRRRTCWVAGRWKSSTSRRICSAT